MAAPLPLPRIRHRTALGVLTLGVVAFGGGAATLYLQREAIGVRLALDYLRAHGVPAVLHLDRLDLGGASGAMRLGPAGRPDLSVGRVEARFGALPAPWRGVRAPPLRALHLFQPVLQVRWADGRLDFGTLQALVDQALAAKPGGGPAPDLYIQDGRLNLATPGGPLTIALDAVIEGGRVRSLHARLEPCDITLAGLRLAGLQGVVSGQATGLGGLHLSGVFGAAASQAQKGEATGARAAGLTLAVEALAPNGAASITAAQRPLVANFKLHAQQFALAPLHGPPLHVRQGDLALDLDGQVDGRNAFQGALRVDGRAAALDRAGMALQAAVLTLRSTGAHAALGGAGLAASGRFTLQVSARGGRLAIAGEDAGLTPFQASASGRLALSKGFTVRAQGALSGGGGLSAAAAERLVRTALGGVDAGGVRPLALALQRVRLAVPAYGLSFDSRRGAALSLPQGARAVFPGGEASLTPLAAVPALKTAGREVEGGLGLALRVQGLPQVALTDGRYRRSAAGALSLAGALSARGDAGPVQGGELRFTGALSGAAGDWALSASDCARISAKAVQLGGALQAVDVATQACPIGDGPLARLGAHGWRLDADLRQARAGLPGAQGRASLASGRVSLTGSRGAPAGRVVLQGLAVEDTSATPRLRPVTLEGALTLADGRVAGRLPLTLSAGAAPLGVVSLDAQLSGAQGRADLDTRVLAFARGGLQPGAIAPAAAHLLPDLQGPLQLLARIAWSPSGIVSSGEVRSEGFSYRSPAGKIDGLRGDVRLTSLAPLVSAPDQTLAADTLETLIPLTQLKASFTLTPRALALKGASARVAGGVVSLDPMRVGLAGAGATTGVLRLKGVDLETLIGALNLANAVSLQAEVDGALPFTLNPAAGDARASLRLADGRVYAEGPGRLTVRREALTGAVATAGAVGAQPNAVQDFAYQALEDLAFTTLEADVASRPQGRLGVIFHVVGRHEPKLAKPTRIGLFALLRGHAFDKPLPLPKGTPVDLTLDTSLNLDDILAAYGVFGGASDPANGSANVQP